MRGTSGRCAGDGLGMVRVWLRFGAGVCGAGGVLAGEGAGLFPLRLGALGGADGGGVALWAWMRGISLSRLPMMTSELGGVALLVRAGPGGFGWAGADRTVEGGVGVGTGVGLAGRSEPRVTTDGAVLLPPGSRLRIPGRSSVPRTRGGFTVGPVCEPGKPGLTGVAVIEPGPRRPSCLALLGMVGGVEPARSPESPDSRTGRVSVRSAGELPTGRRNSPRVGSLLTVAVGAGTASGIRGRCTINVRPSPARRSPRTPRSGAGPSRSVVLRISVLV